MKEVGREKSFHRESGTEVQRKQHMFCNTVTIKAMNVKYGYLPEVQSETFPFGPTILYPPLMKKI